MQVLIILKLQDEYLISTRLASHVYVNSQFFSDITTKPLHWGVGGNGTLETAFGLYCP